jgi:hypothetical protein
MQGSMTIKRRTIPRGIIALAATAVIAAAIPSFANAGPLLSGYGGPGQGNQVILGSTLLGGPGGGSSAATGSGSESGEAAAQATRAAGASLASGARRGPAGTSRHASLAGATSAAGLAPRSYPAVETTSGASDTFGLSGADILYIVLAAVALAFTGVLTRIVAGTRTAKGH